MAQLPFYEVGGAALAEGITKAAELLEKAGELTRIAERCDAALLRVEELLPRLRALQNNRNLSPAEAQRLATKIQEMERAETALQNKALEARSLAGRARELGEEAKEDGNIFQALDRTNCFVAGTLVAMADGTSKPIEQVCVVNEVLSRSENTSQIVAKPVLRVFTHPVESTLVLQTSDGQSVETTPDHPFFVENKGFVPAGQIGVNAPIVTRAGSSVKVDAIQHLNLHKTVYNFEVADFHSYFAGKNGLWVHNAVVAFFEVLPTRRDTDLSCLMKLNWLQSHSNSGVLDMTSRCLYGWATPRRRPLPSNRSFSSLLHNNSWGTALVPRS